MSTIVRDLRGIPFFLLKEYLLEMGGHLEKRNLVVGEGWRAHLKRIEPFCIGSLVVGQTRLTLEIEESRVEDFMARLSKKTLRAGA